MPTIRSRVATTHFLRRWDQAVGAGRGGARESALSVRGVGANGTFVDQRASSVGCNGMSSAAVGVVSAGVRA
jgi:hypothetical protein